MQMKDYILAFDTEEAAGECRKENRILLAGGTNILVKGRGQHDYSDCTIVDIHEIAQLRDITDMLHTLEIGASVTLTELIESRLLQKEVPLLVKAAASVGNCQIRNRGTLGGNIANACPASDCIPAMMVLNAKVNILGEGGVRSLPIAELFQKTKACLRHEGMQVRTCFFKETTTKRLMLSPGEMLQSFTIPKQTADEKFLFYKLSENASSGLGILNIATCGTMSEAGMIETVTSSMGGLFDRPRTFHELSSILIGNAPTQELFRRYAAAAGKILAAESAALVDYEYKSRVMQHLLQDGLAQIFLNIPMEYQI
ncbi:MAG: FAD binding domain-containing protein [Lachnospiraceae bacterium]